MAIYIERQIVMGSTLAVSSLAAGATKQLRDPERQLTFEVLLELGKKMEDAGIEKYEDDLYHGLLHPYDGYDLLATIPQGDVFVSKKKKPAEFPEGGLTVGNFRLVRTSAIGQMLLLGKSSRVLDLVPVWLLAEKDMPKESRILTV